MKGGKGRRARWAEQNRKQQQKTSCTRIFNNVENTRKKQILMQPQISIKNRKKQTTSTATATATATATTAVAAATYSEASVNRSSSSDGSGN